MGAKSMTDIPAARARTKPRSVIVVGAGIVGACLAYRLAGSGIDVTVVETAAPRAGASGGSWAWINAMAATDKSYYDLRRAGIGAWHELEQDLAGTLPLDWSGALVWDSALVDPDTTGAPAAYGARIGASRKITGSEARAIEPLLGTTPTRAILSEEDGLLDAAAATEIVLDAARDKGARLAIGRSVTGVVREDGRAIGLETDHGALSAETVVIAAGVGAPPILSSIGFDLPMANKPGLLVTTAPVPDRLSKALWSERVHIKQRRDGALVIGENAHAPGALDDPDNTARAMISAAEILLPSLAPLTIARTGIATRPIPADGLPVIGPVPETEGLHVAVMHSGVTLAAVTARLLTDEILHGTRSELLAPYRPARFTGIEEKEASDA
jgi:glycine/D-amino acid oxidase-like deaminating enzyme